jgi:hypothetical protein
VTSEFLNKMITSTVISGQRAGWICIEDWDADHTMRGDEEEVFGPPNRHSTTADTSQREVSHPRTLRFTKSARVSRLTLSRRDASQPYSFEHLVGPHPYTCRRYLSPRWSVSANPRTPRPADGPHLAYASEYGRPQPTQGCSRPPHCRHLGEGQTRHLATTSPHVATHDDDDDDDDDVVTLEQILSSLVTYSCQSSFLSSPGAETESPPIYLRLRWPLQTSSNPQARSSKAPTVINRHHSHLLS